LSKKSIFLKAQTVKKVQVVSAEEMVNLARVQKAANAEIGRSLQLRAPFLGGH
jgi:hypothetical protein